VVLVATKLVLPEKRAEREVFIMKNATNNAVEMLALAARVEDPRLKGEILYHLLDILEFEDDREGVIDETSLLAMEVLRKEVNLGTDYVGLYKVYRDCEATAAHNTFAEYCNSVVREVAYELLCVMAERGAKVLGDVITEEELDEMSYDDIISASEIRAEYECDFPEARVDIDAYFWKSIGR
jgi:hypothetical protein